MTHMRATLAGLLVIFITAGGLFAIYHYSATQPERRPDFTLPDLQGQPRSVDEFEGTVRVINFWATWCKPCRKEVPMLIAAQKEFGPRGLQVIGVAVDTREAAAPFADRYGINYPVLAAPTEGARVQDDYTAEGSPAGVLPYTVIVDRDGDMVHHVAGALDRARLLQLVRPLLAPSETATDAQ